MIPNLNEVCDCCGGTEAQPLLQLFDNKCFKIVEGKSTSGEFCLTDFAFPVDGYSCVNINIELGGGEYTLFDNQVGALSPSAVLESGKLYARGIMIKITYPLKDDDGEEIPLVDKSVSLAIQTADTLVETTYPLYTLFMTFTNPKSNQTEDLINKIKIINPNTNYQVRISALVLFGKAI
jgi:hypothetical protein